MFVLAHVFFFAKTPICVLFPTTELKTTEFVCLCRNFVKLYKGVETELGTFWKSKENSKKSIRSLFALPSR